MLALLFLLRCMLDPWNVGYYHLPLAVALLSLGGAAARRAPVAGLALRCAVVTFVWLTVGRRQPLRARRPT